MTFLSSVTGLKATTFFLSPITQAESAELANTRPGGDAAGRGHLAMGTEAKLPHATGVPPDPWLTLAVDLLQLL